MFRCCANRVMSGLFKYFGSPAEKRDRLPLPAVPSLKAKRLKYEQDKRKRIFQEKWLAEFKWLDFDADVQKMSCGVCIASPMFADAKSPLVTKTDRFRKDTLKIHNRSSHHIACSRNKNVTAAAKPVQDTYIGNLFLKCRKQDFTRYLSLFNTAYHLAKHCRPYADFKWIVNLQKENGIEIGKNYINSNGCRLFVGQMAETIKKNICEELEKTKFVTIMSDGSTDYGIIEQELVCLRYISNGQPKVQLIDVVDLEHSHADGVLAGINKGLESVDLSIKKLSPENKNYPNLVSQNYDGAAVNMGRINGTAAKIRRQIPHAIAVHCVAHNLELGVLDSVKQNNYLKQFEGTVKGVFKFYTYSHKRRRDLRALSAVFNASSDESSSKSNLKHFVDIKNIRWLASQERALEALLSNWRITLDHLGNVSNGDGDDAQRAKGYHREMCCLRFVVLLYFMNDFLHPLAVLSKSFQSDKLLIFQVPRKLEATLISLHALKNEPAVHMQDFLSKIDIPGCNFNGVHITTATRGDMLDSCHSYESIVKTFGLVELVNDAINYIESRFKSFTEVPMSSFRVFDNHKIPHTLELLAAYGNEDIKELVRHYESVLSDECQAGCIQEWPQLKVRLAEHRNEDSFELYSDLLSQHTLAEDDDLGNILLLAEIMLTVSPSTAACERGFSIVNRIKTNLRCSLSQESLKQLTLLCAKNLTPGEQKIVVEESVKRWLSLGHKHVRGHKLPGPRNKADTGPLNESQTVPGPSNDSQPVPGPSNEPQSVPGPSNVSQSVPDVIVLDSQEANEEESMIQGIMFEDHYSSSETQSDLVTDDDSSESVVW